MNKEMPAASVEVAAQQAQICMTLQITRADTGLTEEVKVICTPIVEAPEKVDWHIRNGQLDIACGSSSLNS